MKKIFLTTLVGVFAVASAYAQGTISFANGTTSRISTNSVVGGSATGTTAGIAGMYYYALYYSVAATTVGGVTNSVVGASGTYAFQDGNWTFAGDYGTNLLSVGRFASTTADSQGNTVVNGVSGGSSAQFVVIGWSANIGSTVSALNTWYNNGNVSTTGWVGESIVSGSITLGSGLSFPPGLFGAAYPNLTGFTLGEVAPVPEPTTVALAGLGGLSLLLFRRRK